jgi:hypothetical protein
MNRRWVAALVLALAVTVPSLSSAHEGHAHKYMGTVTARQGDQLELKTPEGKTVRVVLNGKTAFARGKQKLDGAALKVGERVVVEVADEKTMIASSVTMAAARAAAQ